MPCYKNFVHIFYFTWLVWETQWFHVECRSAEPMGTGDKFKPGTWKPWRAFLCAICCGRKNVLSWQRVSRGHNPWLKFIVVKGIQSFMSLLGYCFHAAQLAYCSMTISCMQIYIVTQFSHVPQIHERLYNLCLVQKSHWLFVKSNSDICQKHWSHGSRSIIAGEAPCPCISPFHWLTGTPYRRSV